MFISQGKSKHFGNQIGNNLKPLGVNIVLTVSTKSLSTKGIQWIKETPRSFCSLLH
jgi:hypothetical protein